jgi:methylphosphotriester-DNA--protein-cysteine methyltransferase
VKEESMVAMALTRDEMVERAFASDPTADGHVVDVTTTGIYCRPARHPLRKPERDDGAHAG